MPRLPIFIFAVRHSLVSAVLTNTQNCHGPSASRDTPEEFKYSLARPSPVSGARLPESNNLFQRPGGIGASTFTAVPPK